MEPDILIEGISKEIDSALKAMKKAKTLEEKLKHSEMIKNLCDSLGMFLNLMMDIPAYDEDGDPF